MSTDSFLNELQAVSAKASVAEKQALTKQVAGLLDSTLGNDEHLSKAQDILRTIANDAEASVRQTLADFMRSNPQLPKDVASQLARDIESISLPILENCVVLDEEELIDIIKTTESAEKQAAIARREFISENVTGALVEHAKEEIVFTALLENNTAQISKTSLETIVTKNADSEAVMKALTQREQVPIEVLHRVTTNVSERIRQAMIAHIQGKYGMSPHQLESLSDHSRSISVLKILDNRPTLFDARALVTNLIETRRMDAGTFITALLLGKRHFVKYAIALMSGEAFSEVERLIDLNDMPVKFEELLDKADLLPTFAMDIFYALKFIESEPVVGKPANVVIHALNRYIKEAAEYFPNARYFQMMIQSQPAFQQGAAA